MKKIFAVLLLASLCIASGSFLVSCEKEKGNFSDVTTKDKTSSKPDQNDETSENENTTTKKTPSDNSGGATTAETDGTTEEVTTVFDPAKHNYKNTKWDGKTLKILAIGNSFSEDAMTYLYQIAKAEGVNNVILGNLFIGGCTLERHAVNAKNNKADYTYFKNTSGTWTQRNGATLLDGIRDEDWDIITMQQASGYSGVPASYTPHLEYLINYVNANKTNPDAQLVWHMTWAYQSDSTHEDFPKYNKNQSVMYSLICNTVKKTVLPLNVFNIVIPAGTAIQNARTSYFGDKLTRDGYHLNDLGRFIAGYTWFATLTGREVTELKFIPSNIYLLPSDINVIIEAIGNAGKNHFAITNSRYTEKPSFDFSNYTELSFNYTVGGYWNSTDLNRYAVIITDADNSKYFIATEMFTKEKLPAGSVIVIDEGWQYRPEKWTSLVKQSSRDNPTTQNIFIVTEEWWQGYAYRAFNISVAGANKDIRNDPTAVTHFKIYIPISN